MPLVQAVERLRKSIMRSGLLVAVSAAVLSLVHAVAPGNNPTATFMQGRVNLPHAMYGKGYYVVGSMTVNIATPFATALDACHLRGRPS